MSFCLKKVTQTLTLAPMMRYIQGVQKKSPMFQTAIAPTKMAQKSKIVIWTLGAWGKCF